jgi:UDP-glucose 4-epimerase
MLSEARSILVTGGAGFVGSWLVRRLLERAGSARVAVLDNFFNGRREHIPASDQVEVLDVDLTDGARVEDAVRGTRPELVFHLAALHFIPYCNAHPAETLEVNVVGTQNLIEACRRSEPTGLVIASTGAVYPARDDANAEDNPTGAVDIYGLSKVINEKQLELYARDTRTRCAVARLFNVYGPGETNPHVVPEIVDQVARGQDEIGLGNVKPQRDYIYVADVADALMAIASGNAHSYRVYNVGTGHEYSVEELVNRLSGVVGRPIRIRVEQERVRASDRMHLLCDRSRIGREIGWAPRYAIEQGLEELWRDRVRASNPDEFHELGAAGLKVGRSRA